LVEVAVGLARRVVAARDPERQSAALGVVAGTEAVGVIGVDQAVAVVVRAVPTGVELALAGRVVAGPRAAVAVADDHAAVQVDAVQINRAADEAIVEAPIGNLADHGIFAAAAAQEKEGAGYTQDD